jgi:hypothetical protein
MNRPTRHGVVYWRDEFPDGHVGPLQSLHHLTCELCRIEREEKERAIMQARSLEPLEVEPETRNELVGVPNQNWT